MHHDQTHIKAILRHVTLLVMLSAACIAAYGQNQIVYNSPGSYTFTVPPGVNTITVECWGGGGGGSTRTSNGRGGGGGGGAYARSMICVVPGVTYNVVVGGGGTGSSNGGNSVFGADVVVAAGGRGSSTNSTIGGAGGSVANSVGAVRYAGGNGGNANSSGTGGGGGGAGSSGAGGNASNQTPGTGASLNGGDGGAGHNLTANGNPGSDYGGGGGGARSSGSSGTRTGGTGGNGLVIISATPVAMGYNYERNITIDHNQVAGNDDLFNFPVMINLTGQNFLRTIPNGDIFSSDGYDIVFTDESYNQLDHQIEYYNGAAGNLIAWVRLPILSTSANTVIKIIYGNPAVTSDPSVTTVWDSHYRGVWHLNGTPLSDNTAYDATGTSYNSPGYSTGTINNALHLDGSSQYMQVNNASHLNFTGNITVSAWINMDTRSRDQKIAGNQIGDNGGGYKFGVYSNNKLEFEIRTTNGTAVLNRDVSGGTTLSTNTWYYVAGVSSDVLDSIMTYVDGVRERPYQKNGTLAAGSNNLVIGKEPFSSQYFFDGRFDEIRISDKVRSTGWLRTEYNNQGSPSSFYSIDATSIVTENLPSQSLCSGPITLSFGYPAGGVYSGNPYISGNIFTPPSSGTYPISYTYTGGCGSTVITRDFIITGEPVPPTASEADFCESQIATLSAIGQNIRWYQNGTLVSTANPYSPGISTPGSYDFTVTQTVNGCESDPTAVTLSIYSGVTISTQPQPTSVCQGENAIISMSASGFNMNYQWQRNGSNISNGSQYSGVNTPALTILSPSTALSGSVYRCVITTTCGSGATSGNATLTVTAPPVATFSYAGSPYCPNASNPSPSFSGGGTAGTFSSTAGLVFVSTSTGQINISASTPGIYTVTNTVSGSGACSPASATATIEIISVVAWTGSSNTNWNNAANWTCGYIPTSAISVNIPDVANKPVLSSGSAAAVKDLVISPGATLTLTGNTLTIYGTVSGTNSLDASAGTVVFAGQSAQTIPAGLFTGNYIMNLTVNNTNGVSLAGPLGVSGIARVISGSLASEGNLTLLSTASGTALIDGSGSGSVTGDVNMQRYLPSGFGYKYFSSPFQDATVNEFGDDMDLAYSFPLFYRFDENSSYSGWVSYVNGSDPLNPLEGYAANLGEVSDSKTVDLTGSVNNGNMSVTLYNRDRTYTMGFNLVGNPYPSPIDWNAAGWTKTNIDNAIYYFRASTTDQYGGTYSSYVNGISSDGLASNIIPSMQGFLVHVSDGAYPVTGTLGVSNSIRVTNQTQPFLKSSNTTKRSIIRALTGFTDDTASYDPLVIYFDDSADTAFESRNDALKLFNTDMMVTNFYSVLADGQKLSVNALPEQDDSLITVPLGISIYRDGEVRFCLQKNGDLPEFSRIYLKDMGTGAVTPLLPSGDYKVSLKAGEYNNRFIITIHKTLTSAEDLTGPQDKLFDAYVSNGTVRARIHHISGNEGLISVYTLGGNLISVTRVSETGIHDLGTRSSPGMYLIRYATGNKNETKKLIVGSR